MASNFQPIQDSIYDIEPVQITFYNTSQDWYEKGSDKKIGYTT